MSELSSAIRAVCEEKGLSYDSVVETIELSLAAAYRKDYGQKNQNIKVDFNPDTGKSKIFDIKTVVEDLPEDYDEEKIKELLKENPEDESIRRFNPKTEICLSDAKLVKKSIKLGDELTTELEVPDEYGRMAAQTAKQVIIQKLREAEREMVFNEFKDKEGEVIVGVVQRKEGRNVLVDLGKSVGKILPEDQIYGENYAPGAKVKVYVREVRAGSRGAEIILSRTSEEILKKVFYLEIPEIANKLVEIKAVAREAGSRSKVAIWSDEENVDPIGSCVGQRGSRIQTIISELGGERVDMVSWDEDISKFIINALSPAKIISVKLNEEEKSALVKVASDQLSLAIGKRGQNVRLAARLTGWKINIEEDGAESAKEDKDDDKEEEVSEGKEDKKEKKDTDKEKVKDANKKKKDTESEEVGKDKEVKKEKKVKDKKKDESKDEKKDKSKDEDKK